MAAVARPDVPAAATGVHDDEARFLPDLARRSTYWWERCGGTSRAAPDDEALRPWEQVLGGAEHLERRLRWEGLDRERARGVLPAPAADADAALPPWAGVVGHLTRGLHRRVDVGSADALLDPGARFPFEHLLAPLVHAAADLLGSRLEGEHGSGGADLMALLAPAAHRDLQRALLARLSALLAEPLYTDFGRSRPYGPMLLGRVDAVGPEGTPDTAYRHFVASTAADSMRGFFDAYPVAARLVGTAADQWVDAVRELLERLADDAAAITDHLLGGAGPDPRPLPVVARVEASLSDAHRGGRSVAVLTFSDGRRLVYKPKSLALEAALGRLLTWCSQRGGFDLRAVRVLDRGAYGWAEHVDHEPCQDEDAVRRYFRRAGSLLCLLHVLRASDCHHGNLVASGEHPVLVDAETLFHARARALHPDTDDDGPGEVTRDFLGSVLRTMMLPGWHVSGDGRFAYDISGLGSSGAEPLPAPVQDWAWINTDAMVLRSTVGTLPPEKNVVRLRDQDVPAADHVPEIVSGFRAMYDRLLEDRDALRDPSGPLAGFRDLPTRFLFRGTRIYASVLTGACAPEHLTDGARFSVQLDLLSRAFVQQPSRPPAWPILAEELQALGQLDIPYFAGTTTSAALDLGDGARIERYFEASGYDDMRATVDGLDDDDRAWQVALIEGSFQAQAARHEAVEAVAPVQREATPATRSSSWIDAARQVGVELHERSLVDSRGEAHWLGLSLLAQTERVQLELIGESLYDGRCGVGLFLAALHRVTGEERWAHLARASLAPLDQLAEFLDSGAGEGRDPALLPSLGATGSIVYALVCAGDLLDEPRFTATAQRCAATIRDEVIAADTAYDVLSGAAGAILGLLRLHESSGDQLALGRATACGEHLLHHRSGTVGRRAWTNLAPVPLAGFSHGAAGIAYALTRLSQATGDPRFGVGASEAIAYERAVFSPEHGNWPDLRDLGAATPAYPTQWCHGATGIALARLGGRSATDDPEVDEEIRTALQTTARAGTAPVDHLCCGNMGRAEALLVGSAALGRPDWRDAAERLARQVADRRAATGCYRLFPNLPRAVFSPGFFRGVSGIGYQWLRLARPDLPSVLLWE